MDFFTPDTLQTTWFQILAAFVALNTIIYTTIAIIGVLPRLYPTKWLSGMHTRSESRSIYPGVAE